MADDTNIDDILKSIDTLLKESEGNDAEDKKGQRRRDAAINDDVSSEATEVEEPVHDEQDEEDKQGDTASQAEDYGDDPAPDESDDIERDEIEAVEDQEVEGASVTVDDVAADSVAEQHADELQQEADAADMDDHPTNLPVEADTEEKDVPPVAQSGARRIVLSEDMQVEDTPDLPLAFADDDPTVEDQAEDVDGAASAELIETEQGNNAEEDVVDSNTPDIEMLIEKISAEVIERLNRELPTLVSPLLAELVAEAVQKHVGGKAESGSTGNGDE